MPFIIYENDGILEQYNKFLGSHPLNSNPISKANFLEKLIKRADKMIKERDAKITERDVKITELEAKLVDKKPEGAPINI